MDTNIRNDVNAPYRDSYDKNFTVDHPMERDSWKVMFEHLYADMTRLFERESLLIRTEVREKFMEAKVAVGSLAVGAMMLFIGAFAAAATAIILLDQFLPLWASALIVTAVLCIAGYVMVTGALKKLEGDRLTPRQSLETLGEITTTFKERINEFKHH
ncbi:MAG TPA: phage holin family protein [Bacteriovoracaceae bacterium]|nr:phage holin family protein [Bacteriovoracaceae bacterium]